MGIEVFGRGLMSFVAVRSPLPWVTWVEVLGLGRSRRCLWKLWVGIIFRIVKF